MTKKQIIITVIGILLVIGVGVAFYLLFFRSGVEVPPITGQATPQLPEGMIRPNADISNVQTEFSSLRKLSDKDAFYFWTVQSEIYYIATDGTVLSAKDGTDIELSQQVIEALRFVEISPHGSFLLASFGDPFSLQWTLFDTLDKVWRPLPGTIIDAAWGENDKELVVFITDGTSKNLATMDISKNPPVIKTIVKNFLLNDVSLTFLKPQALLLTERSSSQYPGRVWQLDTKTQTLSSIFDADYNTTLLFNREYQTIFRSGNGRLSLYSPILESKTSVTLETFPTKCDFSNEEKVFCFVPHVMPPLDSYLMKQNYTLDDVYEISLANDSVYLRLVSGPGLPAVDATNVRSFGNNDLYFINRYDRGIYHLHINDIPSVTSTEEEN